MALSKEDLLFIDWQGRWRATARPDQLLPDTGWSQIGVQAGRGYGKQLCKETPIPTPSGWRRLGDLEVGDEVFDETGTPCRIVATYEQPVTRAYRLTFSDGATITACEDHLWVTWTHRERKQFIRHHPEADDFPENWPAHVQPLWDSRGNVVGAVGPEVRTTAEIVDTLVFGTRDDTNHCIPTCHPLQYPQKALPLDPWALGYWLGNGATVGPGISTHQDDTDLVVARYEALGYSVTRYANGRDGYVKGLLEPLRAVGVVGDKHVPRDYLQGSVEQREALLAGLLDSDGHCSLSAGHIEFCSTLRCLADSVVELARSLGQKPVLLEDRARLNGKDCGPRYRVKWRSTYQPFSLPRKAAAWRTPGAQALRNRHRMIVAAEEVAPVPMRCLTVDSPNSMFLCGEAMIPTHNTRVGAEWLGQKAYRDTNKFPFRVIAPTLNDVRFTCFEGQSGLLNVIPPELVADYNKTNLLITLINGATIRGFGTEEPERLRGPNSAGDWGDEVAAWIRDQEAWDQAAFGRRLGVNPQVVWTSTPKPKTLIRNLTEPKAGRIIIRGSTYDNRENLAESFYDELKKYEGTKLGRQELEGELIDAEEGGIIARSWFKLWPASKPLPKFEWIIMSLDTAFTERTLDKRTHDPDPSACAVFGIFWHEDVMNVLVLDCWSDHLGMPDLITRVKRELNTAYGDDEDTALIKPMFGPAKPTTSGRKPDLLIIEDKGSGISLRQSLSKEGIHAYPYNPGRADKLARLHMVSHLFARGYFWLPESEKRPGKPRTWTEPALDQLCSFRGGGSIKHDDFVDVFSQASRVIMDKGLLSGVKRESKSVREAPAPPKPRVNPYAI